MGILSHITTFLTAASCFCSPFQIKLYWEDGYRWQEQDDEFVEFCLTHSYRGFPGFGVCWEGRKIHFCQDDAVYIARCTGDRRQKWIFEPISKKDSFQIRAVTRGQCLERIPRSVKVRMRDCDASSSYQRFFTPGQDTTTDDYRFAISQGSSNLCLGQQHHPKVGEMVGMEQCRKAYRDDTKFWEKGNYGLI